MHDSFEPQLFDSGTAPKRRGLLKSLIATAAIGAALVPGLGFHTKETSAIAVPAECSDAAPNRVVLIALDGVRWQDIYEGADAELLGQAAGDPASAEELTPHLHELMRRGVALGAPGHGAPFSASGPNFVSLPGYTELLTGKPPVCQENDCTDVPRFTLLDGFAERSDASGVGAFSSWSNIGHVATSAGSTATVNSGLPNGEYRADQHTARLALSFAKTQSPAFMFVSLGDTDEHAHDGDYESYLEALRQADNFIGDIIQMSDAARDRGIETLIVVTADHGRAEDFMHHGRSWPESARSWLVAAGGPVPRRGLVDASAPHFLRDVAPTIAALTGVELEVSPTSGKVIEELAPGCTPIDTH